jgi:hypothetical protein
MGMLSPSGAKIVYSNTTKTDLIISRESDIGDSAHRGRRFGSGSIVVSGRKAGSLRFDIETQNLV